MTPRENLKHEYEAIMDEDVDKLVKQNTPMEVNISGEPICPICGYKAMKDEWELRVTFCPQCGQRLSWIDRTRIESLEDEIARLRRRIHELENLKTADMKPILPEMGEDVL